MTDKQNRITIREVAQMAGVSFQTVSLVINHPEKVAEKTLRHVQSIIESVNFVPSMAARSMRRIRTRTIACIFFGERASYDNRSFQIQDTYWNNVVQMLSQIADSVGYSLLQRNQAGNDAKAFTDIRELYVAGRIDGMIAVVEKTSHPVLEELRRHGFPFVVFGTRDPAFPYVAQNNESACAEIVDHLHASGCRRIAFISGERDGHVNQDVSERLRGYRKSMKKHQLPVEKEWLMAGDWSLASGHRIAQQLCLGADAPDALIFASDRMALGALKGLHDAGVRVPQDVSVVGFDNMQYDDFSIPPLSSVHSPVLEMASAAVKMLLAEIEGKAQQEPVQQVFQTRLAVRESTRAADLSASPKKRKSGSKK